MSNTEYKLKQVKIIIKSLLLSSTRDFNTINTLQNDYTNENGSPIPVRELGYDSMLDFLRDIDDTINVTKVGGEYHVSAISNNKTNHITYLISKQRKTDKRRCKKPSKNNFSRTTYFRKKIPQNKPFVPLELQQNIYDFLKDKPDGVTLQALESYIYNHTNFKIDEVDGLWGIINYCSEIKMSGGRVNLKSNAKQISRVTDEDSKEIQVLKQNISILCEEHKEGILCSKLNAFYKHKFKKFIDFSILGYSNIIQLIEDMSDAFCLQKINQSDWLILPKKHTISTSKNKKEPICNKFLANDRENLKKKNENMPLRLRDGLDIREEASYENGSSSSSFLDSSDDSNFMEIKQQSLPKIKTINDIIEIIVTEIYSPNSFWINLYSHELTSQFYNFFDEMQKFYREYSSTLIIEPNEISKFKNQYAVAFHQNEWHRILILHTLKKHRASKVIFIDSGTERHITDKICVMTDEFYKFPAQAISCSLSRIVPHSNSSTWSLESCRRFRELIINKPLFALISSLNVEANSFSAILIDTSTKKDEIINKRLIDEGLANFFFENDSSERSKSSSSFDNDPPTSLRLYVKQNILDIKDEEKKSIKPLIGHRVTVNPDFILRQVTPKTLDYIKSNLLKKRK